MRKTRHFGAVFFFLFFFALGFGIFQYTRPQSGSIDEASRDPAAQIAARVWSVGAYLPEKPTQKVYLQINGRTIQNIVLQKPQGLVLETESIVFPGLMDMHNHVKYNILPLWSLGKGQFLNRFEWRQKFPPYKDAVSFNMKPIKGDTACAAVRWAEIKSLLGGGTSMQGIGGDSKCANGFGVMNVEIPGDLSPGKIRALTDLVTPDMMGAVYLPSLAPEIQKNRARLQGVTAETFDQNQRRIYDVALMNLLNKTGILAWLDAFANQPRSLQLGLKLTMNMDTPKLPNNDPGTFMALVPKMREHLTNNMKLKPNAVEKQIANLQIWFYGKDGRSGYLALPLPRQPIKDFALIDDSQTMNYFGKAGVISVDPKVRRYLAMFETATRRSVLKYFDSRERMAVIAHLSEGGRSDAYNRAEYSFAQDLGFARPGLVMIHGVGLDKNQLVDAGRKNLSIVWSPFSNLLLYGETLDVQTARRAGVNIALGPDWSPTGSKHMLDELKIARRYLNKIRVSYDEISDHDLIDMATINAARALGLDRVLGRVAPGYTANLLFLDKNTLQAAKDPWTALVNASQKDLNLVSVAGEPVYGDLQLIQTVAQAFRDPAAPEALPRMPQNQQKCEFVKGLRMPWYSAYDQTLQAKGLNFRSVAGIEAELQGKMGAYAQLVKAQAPRMAGNLAWLDPLFNCEDDYYTREFSKFIEVSLDQNRQLRPRIRSQYRLNDKWSPIREPVTEGDADESAQE